MKKYLQVSVRKIIDEFSVASSTGKYRSTSHKYKFNITNNTSVTDSSLILDDNFFLSLTPFEAIFSGSLNADFLIDNKFL